jgi:hypothetical protein
MEQGVCRRGKDRRQTNQPFHFYSMVGRRRQPRRLEDGSVPSVDTHPPIYLLITMLIMALCIADAFNTLQLLSDGAEELNPVMDVLIRNNIQLFIIAKFALTGLGLLVLVGYRDSTFIIKLKSRHILYGVFAMYATLIVYQSALLPDHIFGLVLPI